MLLSGTGTGHVGQLLGTEPVSGSTGSGPGDYIPGQSYSTSLSTTSSTTAENGNSSTHHETILWVDGEDAGRANASSSSNANPTVSDSKTATWTVGAGSYSGAKLGIQVAVTTCVGTAAYYYEYTWQP